MRKSYFSGPPHAVEAATALVGGDEVLVADARSGQTPSQMVEQKLVALLGSGHPGMFSGTDGSVRNFRGLPGK